MVFYNGQVQEVAYLAGLSFPQRDSVRDTRIVLFRYEQVAVSRLRTRQHQRTFLLEYTFSGTCSLQKLTTQQVKVHMRQGTLPTQSMLINF